MAMPDYSKELATCKCPSETVATPHLNIILKKGEEISIPNDTSALGVGATESFIFHNSDSPEFKSLNTQGSFEIADNLLRFPDKTNPLVQRCNPEGSKVLSTDCGNNATGIPLYTVSNEKKGMRVPVDISGNWTPQQIHGHVVFEPSGQVPGISVAITTIRTQTDCDPDGCGAPVVLGTGGRRGGNNTQQLHIFKVSDNFAEIFCCAANSVTLDAIGFVANSVLIELASQAYNSPLMGAGAKIETLNGNSIACQIVKTGALPESPVAIGTPHLDIGARLRYLRVRYTANNGAVRYIKLTTYDEIGTIRIAEPSNIIQTCNNWIPAARVNNSNGYNCDPASAFPEPSGVSNRDCHGGTGWGSATAGQASNAGPVCSGAATINGVTFNNTIRPFCRYSWDNAADFLRLGNGYIFSESTGYSFSVSVGGTTVSVAGSVTINKPCGEELTLACSGAFYGTKTLASCGNNTLPGHCTDVFTGPSGSGESADITLMSISIPTSTKRLYVKGRIFAAATCNVGVQAYAQIGAACLIWIEIY